VEIMVSLAVLMLLVAMTLATTNHVSALFTRTRAKIDTFQEARAGFEQMTRRLSQAMLNTYWDYGRDNTGALRDYLRQSELHFVCGPTKSGLGPLLSDPALQSLMHGLFFQAPLGFSSPTPPASQPTANLQNLLNVTGYFLEYGSDKNDRPLFLRTGEARLAERWRTRLMEFQQPTESLQLYRVTSAGSKLKPYDWFREPLKNVDSGSTPGASAPPITRRVLAENIVALALWPHRSKNEPPPPGASRQLAPDYLYDSRLHVSQPADKLAPLTRNQLPPMVQVTMIAIDETSAARLQDRLTDATKLPVAELGLGSLFLHPSTTATPTADKEGDQYRADLKTLEAKLIELRLTYRVFSTDVSILQAKWSEN
jgi:uncharacterized protein (TIGR02599 family)